MAQRWREGWEVVYGVRRERAGESLFKLATASIFYRLLNRLSDVQMPLDVGDFRLIDRKAVEAFKLMPERNRYVRGMIAWIGFRQTGVEYSRAERYAGETKYPLKRMLKFAVNAIVGFSQLPLRIALALGFVVAGAAFAGGVAAVALKAAGVYVVPGWASIVAVVGLLGGVQLMVMGMLGVYIGRMYEEVKRRPLYIVRETHGLTHDASTSLDADSATR
jgi:dolichol-phosphate mannosyltransferase